MAIYSRSQRKILARTNLCTALPYRTIALVSVCMRIASVLNTTPYITPRLPRGYKIGHYTSQKIPYLILEERALNSQGIRYRLCPEIHITYDLADWQAQVVINDLLTGWLQEIRQFLKETLRRTTWPCVPRYEEDKHLISYIKDSLRDLELLMKGWGFKVKSSKR